MWFWYVTPVVLVATETPAGTINVPQVASNGQPWSGRFNAHVPTGEPANALVGLLVDEVAPVDWTPVDDEDFDATFTSLMGYSTPVGAKGA